MPDPPPAPPPPAEGRFVVAVIDNRAHECGVACFSRDSPSLVIGQFVDSKSFSYLRTLFQLYPPSEVLIVGRDGGKGGPARPARSTPLAGAVAAHITPEAFPGTGVVQLSRGQFNDTEGEAELEHLCVDQAALNEAKMKKHYLAMAAAHAVLGHMGRAHGCVFSVHSLGLRLISNCGRLSLMDSACVDALELVDGLGGQGKKGARLSVFGLLRAHARTVGGAQMIKAALLQPVTDIPTLDMRLDLLESLLADQDLFDNVQAVLSSPPLKDVDRVLSGMSVQTDTERHSQARLSRLVAAVIRLQELLAVAPKLADTLSGASTPLAVAIREAASSPAFDTIRAALEANLDEDVATARGSFTSKTQQIFAIKTGAHRLLDLCRQAFAEGTEQVHRVASDLQDDHGLAHLKLSYSRKRGFYLSFPAEDLEGNCVPDSFIQVETKGKMVTCSTPAVGSLNRRLVEAENDCLRLTTDVLQSSCVDVALRHIGALQQLAESVHLLDMAATFASFVSSSSSESSPFTRPVFSEGGPIAIVDGRHILLDKLIKDAGGGEGGSAQVPNSVFLNECSTFGLITGPNMAGKSTLLKQVAITVILAQAGCYAPARLASLRPVDRVLTRMGHGDSVKTNASSFLAEMQDVAHIVGSATSRSLVLIDELGRSTSTEDGVGVAWATSEFLISLGCFTLFATHMSSLRGLATLYPSAFHQSMEVSLEPEGGRGLDFKYRLRGAEVAASVPHYGLRLAVAAGMPPDVLRDGWRIAERVEAEAARSGAPPPSARASGGARHSSYDVVSKLLCLAQAGLSEADVRHEIRALQHTLA